MDRSRGWRATKIGGKVAAASGKSRMVGNLHIEANQLDKRLHKTFGLPPWQTQEQAQVKSSLHRDIRVATLAASAAVLLGSPGRDRLGREPHGQTSTPYQALIAGRPVGDAVASFVIRVDLRPFSHPQIMIRTRRRGKRGSHSDSCTNAPTAQIHSWPVGVGA